MHNYQTPKEEVNVYFQISVDHTGHMGIWLHTDSGEFVVEHKREYEVVFTFNGDENSRTFNMVGLDDGNITVQRNIFPAVGGSKFFSDIDKYNSNPDLDIYWRNINYNNFAKDFLINFKKYFSLEIKIRHTDFVGNIDLNGSALPVERFLSCLDEMNWVHLGVK